MADNEDGRAEGAPIEEQTGQAEGETTREGGQGGAGGDGGMLEKLQKQIADLERFKHERDSLVTENKKLQQELLSKLTDAVSGKKDQVLSRDDTNKRLKALGKEINQKIEDGQAGDAIVELIAEYGEMIEQSAENKSRKEISELRELVERMQSSLHEYDSEYVANRNQVEEWAKTTGLDPVKDRKALLAIVKKTAKPSQPPRPQVPSAPGGSGVTPSRSDVQVISAETWAMINETQKLAGLGPLTDSQKKELEQQWSKQR